MLFPTSLVGSYPQPEWLIDRARLRDRFPPRVRATELWRVAPEYLEQAQRDATELAIRAQERAGLDIITDGEIRRESYSNRFATALDGVDIDNPGTALDRSGEPNLVPRVTGPVRRRHPVEVGDVEFLRATTRRTIKITVPGPFTMAQQAQNDYYTSTEDLALGYAEAVNEEVADLFRAGADIVQLDEPYLQARPDEARKYGVRVINRALQGITGTTAVHLCFGYAAIIHERPSGYSFLPELADCVCDQVSIETAQSGLDCEVLTRLDGKTIILGVLNLGDETVENPAEIVARARRALKYVPAEQDRAGPGLRHEVPPGTRRSASSSRCGWPPPCSAPTPGSPPSPDRAIGAAARLRDRRGRLCSQWSRPAMAKSAGCRSGCLAHSRFARTTASSPTCRAPGCAGC